MSEPVVQPARQWTEQEDRFLIFYGRCLNLAFGGEPKGYEYIAWHDLQRTPEEAIARVKLLRLEAPRLVAEIEAEADREPEDV